MLIELIPSIEYIMDKELSGKTVVLIDVLRATSVITTALNNGAYEVIPKIQVDETLKLKSLSNLLGGERKALKIEGFDLTNSPLDYNTDIVKDKTIILSTTNGTKAIHQSLFADRILIGCMLNGKAIAKNVYKHGGNVTIVCAGTNGKFSLDDFITAGKIIFEYIELSNDHPDLDDFAATAFMAYRDNKEDVLAYVAMASHYKYLISIGLEEDIKYCFTEDIIEIVPEVIRNNGEISIR